MGRIPPLASAQEDPKAGSGDLTTVTSSANDREAQGRGVITGRQIAGRRVGFYHRLGSIPCLFRRSNLCSDLLLCHLWFLPGRGGEGTDPTAAVSLEAAEGAEERARSGGHEGSQQHCAPLALIHGKLTSFRGTPGRTRDAAGRRHRRGTRLHHSEGWG